MKYIKAVIIYLLFSIILYLIMHYINCFIQWELKEPFNFISIIENYDKTQRGLLVFFTMAWILIGGIAVEHITTKK